MPGHGDTSPFDAAPPGAPPEEPEGAFASSAVPDTGRSDVAPGAAPVASELSPGELHALREKLRAKFH